jgi:ABC-type glycerol-3-phosphate transport system permease component
VTQEARYLEDFWHQFGNSLYIGLLTMVLTVLIGSLASFAVSRMRLSKGSLLTNAALLTYAIPPSFLIFPFYRIIHSAAELALRFSPRSLKIGDGRGVG